MRNFIHKEFKKSEKYSFHITEKLMEPENNISQYLVRKKYLFRKEYLTLKNVVKKVRVK